MANWALAMLLSWGGISTLWQLDIFCHWAGVIKKVVSTCEGHAFVRDPRLAFT
jgi:hypothetical protein